KGERAPAPFEAYFLYVEHFGFFHLASPPDRGRGVVMVPLWDQLLNRLIPCKSKSVPGRLERRATPIPWNTNSAAQAQARDQRLVPLGILGLDIVEQTAPFRHHLDHAPAGMIVLHVVLEMLGEIGDALGEDGDLDFRRTGVTLGGRVFGDQFFLAF